MILERKIGDFSLWEFVIVLVIIHLIIGVLVNMFNK